MSWKLKRWGLVFLMRNFKALLKFWTGKSGKINLALSTPTKEPQHFPGEEMKQCYPAPTLLSSHLMIETWGMLTCLHSVFQPLLSALGFCTHFPLFRIPFSPSFQLYMPLTPSLCAPTHPGLTAVVAFSRWVVISCLFPPLNHVLCSGWNCVLIAFRVLVLLSSIPATSRHTIVFVEWNPRNHKLPKIWYSKV